MTNCENIKNMSVEEMEIFIGKITEYGCVCCGIDYCFTNGKKCVNKQENGIRQWLNKEVANE